MDVINKVKANLKFRYYSKLVETHVTRDRKGLTRLLDISRGLHREDSGVLKVAQFRVQG